MSASTKMMAFNINMVNGLFNYLGAQSRINENWGAISGSIVNMLAVCTEMIEQHGGDVRKLTGRQAFANIVKVCGPLGGIAQNQFYNLALATALLGMSAVGVFTAPVSGPVAVGLAAMGLFCDAIAFGAAAAGVPLPPRRKNAASWAKVEALLQNQYRNGVLRAPTVGRPAPR